MQESNEQRQKRRRESHARIAQDAEHDARQYAAMGDCAEARNQYRAAYRSYTVAGLFVKAAECAQRAAELEG